MGRDPLAGSQAALEFWPGERDTRECSGSSSTGGFSLIPFDSTRQCCWCGSNNEIGVIGYGGERTCPVCGWGGDGEPDVPCMFYRLVPGKTISTVPNPTRVLI